MLYALLDGEKAIDRPHVEAALALWTYCEQSARDVWGDALGWPTADKILAAERDRGRLTGTDIRDLFGRHQPADLQPALDHLVASGRLSVTKAATGGRPSTVYASCDISDISDRSTQNGVFRRIGRFCARRGSRVRLSDRELDALREAEALMSSRPYGPSEAYELLRLTLAPFRCSTPEGAWLLRRALEIVGLEPRTEAGRRIVAADMARFEAREVA